jgi:hypothetical protein
MKKITILIFLTSLTSVFSSLGQAKVSMTDSLRLKIRCESFYEWYIDLIKKNEIDNFNPQFVKTTDGMTGLDFTSYRDGLKNNFVTEELVNNLVNNFQACQESLKSIPFERFKSFTDLDQFESISCDFSNRYEFTGGMEPIDVATLTRIRKLNRKMVQVTMTLFNFSDGKKRVHGQKKMTLQRHKKNVYWKISNIQS